MTGSRIGSAFAAVAITAIAVYLLLTDEVIAVLRQSIQTAAWGPLVLALLLGPVIQLARAWRFNVLLWGSTALPSMGLYRITSLLVFFNYLLPFRTGELSFPVMVARSYGVHIAHGSGVLVLTRVLDLLVVAGLGCGLASIVLPEGIANVGRLGWILGAVLLAGMAMAVVPIARHFHTGIDKLVHRWARTRTWIDGLFQGARDLTTWKQHAVVGLSTLAVWSLQLAVAVLVTTAVTDEIAPVYAMFATTVAILAFALPINGVAGLGPVQAAWALGLEPAGARWALGIATSTLWHAVLLVGAVVLAAIVSWRIPPPTPPDRPRD